MPTDLFDRLDEMPRPWGLDPKWLGPAKVIRDPIEEDVGIVELERWLIDSPPLQRLRRTRQLGATHYVFPGGTHTRFAHSVGTIAAAQKLMRGVMEQRHHPHATVDLLGEWQAANRDDFAHKVAEMIVLARLGALLHDMNHLPYGHSVEDDLGILEAHDASVARFSYQWRQIDAFLGDRLTALGREADYANLKENLISRDSRLYKSLRPLILAKETDPQTGLPLPPPNERIDDYPFVADIVGNTICADLLDYLVRDHAYTGLPMQLGERFLSAFFVTPSNRARFSQRMALSIVRGDRERTDVVSELLKHLRYRYEETERVLTHHAKLAADAMVGKALEMWRDHVEEHESPAVLDAAAALFATDDEDLEAGSAARESKAELTPSGAATATDESQSRVEHEGLERSDAGAEVVLLRSAESPITETALRGAHGEAAAIAARQTRKTSPASRWIEREMLRRSDDGLLERMRDFCEERLEQDHADSSRLRAIQALAEALLGRDLYKPIDRVSHQQGSAREIYEAFGDAATRRRLERAAAAHADIEHAWMILIWLPPPEMRLKVAEVLVYDGSDIAPFHQSEAYRNKRGTDIYEAHQRLWGISFYAHRSITESQHRAARAHLAAEMEVRWDKMIEELGNDPKEWMHRLALRDAHEEQVPTISKARQNRLVREQIAKASLARTVGGHERPPTHASLVRQYVEALASESR